MTKMDGKPDYSEYCHGEFDTDEGWINDSGWKCENHSLLNKNDLTIGKEYIVSFTISASPETKLPDIESFVGMVFSTWDGAKDKRINDIKITTSEELEYDGMKQVYVSATIDVCDIIYNMVVTKANESFVGTIDNMIVYEVLPSKAEEDKDEVFKKSFHKFIPKRNKRWNK